MTLSGATFPGQSGPGSNGNGDILCIPQSSSITGASLSDCLISDKDTRCRDVTIPPRPPLHQLLRNHFNLDRWSSSGSDRGIAHFLMATRNTIKGVGEKNKEQTRAWVNWSARKLSCDTLHSFAYVDYRWRASFAKFPQITGMLTHLDWPSLTVAGLCLMPIGLFSDWCRLPTATLRLPSPTGFCGFLLPTPVTRVPLPTSGHVEDRGLRPLFGFAPKQTKGSSAWRTTYIVSQRCRWYNLQPQPTGLN